jgi:hypothetical protein
MSHGSLPKKVCRHGEDARRPLGDMSPLISDEAGLLNGMGDDRHACPSHLQHLGDELLCERNLIAADQVRAPQEPATETGFDHMGRIACACLLRLGEKKLLMSVVRKPGSRSAKSRTWFTSIAEAVPAICTTARPIAMPSLASASGEGFSVRGFHDGESASAQRSILMAAQ